MTTRLYWIDLLLACCSVALFGCITTAPFSACTAENLPNASNLVQRMVVRAQDVARTPQTNHYIYEKRALKTELDEKDRVTKSTEKLYQVALIGGLPFSKLAKIQGQELTPAELERQNQRETAFRQQVTRVDMKKRARNKEGLVTQDLADRFVFEAKRREIIHGRPTIILAVAPRPDAPNKSIEDKIFKHVFGTVWVDEQEAEVTKLDASVRGPIPLGWFGAIGSLHKFHIIIERARLPDGVWVNQKSSIWVVARKLLSMMRVKVTEEASGFRREQKGN